MSDRTLTAAEHPHGLSPMVEAVRLENAIRRKRRQVEKLATKLQDAEFERQVFEAALERVRAPNRFPSSDGEASAVKAARGVDDPELGSTVARSGGTGRQPTASSAPASPAASAEQLVPSGTAGADSGGSADGTDPGGAHDQAPVTPAEPAGSSTHRTVTSHAYAPPGGGFLRGGSAWGKRAKDETGKRYGKLTVIERAPNDGNLARWRCGCDCGASCVVAGAYLRQGKVTGCPTCHVDGRKHQACSICGDRNHRSPWCPQRPQDEPEVADGFKRCCQCRAVKPVADFYAHTASGGYQARCKLCDNKARVQRSPKRADCAACKSMPSRVEGPLCVDCGLEAERPPRATDFSGGDSALARAIG